MENKIKKVELEFNDNDELRNFMYLVETAQHFLDQIISLWGGNQYIYDDSNMLTKIKWKLYNALEK